jgi:hypothetical protein
MQMQKIHFMALTSINSTGNLLMPSNGLRALEF